jgi:transcriptional regulator with XRE-family HTH domain
MVSPMTFGEWLGGELARLGVSRRELARRLAAQYPGGDDLEAQDSQRRTVRRILSGATKHPTRQTRDSICDALDVPRESAPDEDGDAPITRKELHEFRRLALKLERSLSRSTPMRTAAA